MSKFSGLLIHDLTRLIGHLSTRRRWQLLLLLILVSLSAISEILSLGAVIPFLGSLSNPESILASPKFGFLTSVLHIESTHQLIIWSSIVFAITITLASALRLLTLWLSNQLTARISTDLSQACFRTTILQPYSFYLNHNSSDLITAAKDYLDGTIQVVQSCLTFGGYSIVLITVLIGLLVFDWQVTIVLFAMVSILMGGVVSLTRLSLKRDSIQLVSLAYKRIELLQVSLGSIRDILLDNNQRIFIDTYAKIDRPIRLLQGKIRILSGVTRPLLETIVLISLIALILFRLFQKNGVDDILPVLGGLALGANRLLPAVQQCFAAWAGIQGYSEHLNKFLTTLDRPASYMVLAEKPSPLTLTRDLRLENVWFRYNIDVEWILSGIELKIPAFSTVGFIGPSGCGKSTVSDILLGLLEPQKGSLVIDGNPIVSKAQRQTWQSTVAHVPQSIYLSDSTVAENIAFGQTFSEIDWSRLESAAKLAQIHELIEGMPNGYYEIVGERGVRLSGGQRQRIGIARALYKNASVIVFDEATSALDSKTENDLMDSIYSLSSRLTIIMIAHRLSTLNRCDHIFEFDKGQIREITFS